MRRDPLQRLWISAVDSCVSILGLPGAETHMHTHSHTTGGRERGWDVSKKPLICIKPHFYLMRANTTTPPSFDSSSCLSVCTRTHTLIHISYLNQLYIHQYHLMSSSPLYPIWSPRRQHWHARKPSGRGPQLGRHPEIAGFGSWRTIHAVILFYTTTQVKCCSDEGSLNKSGGVLYISSCSCTHRVSESINKQSINHSINRWRIKVSNTSPYMHHQGSHTHENLCKQQLLSDTMPHSSGNMPPCDRHCRAQVCWELNEKQSHLLYCAKERLQRRLCHTLTTSDNKVITSLRTDGFSQRCRVRKCQRMTAERNSFHALFATLTACSDTHKDPWLLSCSLGNFLKGPTSTFWLPSSIKVTTKYEIWLQSLTFWLEI